MSQVINTNIASLNAQRNLAASQGDANVALQRLSSGLRINSAKDDAAGLAISERFQSQISGLNMAQRNANDGISLAQTAEGAMDEITNNLQRIRELAVQSANATNSVSDRQALNQEVQQRIEEINRIASQTSFNGLKVLDGTFATQTFQVGANTGETIAVSGLDSRGSQIGAVVAQTTGLSEFILETGTPAETEIDFADTDLNFGAGTGVTGTVTINDVVLTLANPATSVQELADEIDAAIAALDPVTDADSLAALEGITLSVSGDTLTFTNANPTAINAAFALSDDDAIAAASVTRAAGTDITAGNTENIDISALNFTTGGTLEVGGNTVTIDPGATTDEIASLLATELGGDYTVVQGATPGTIDITNTTVGDLDPGAIVFNAEAIPANSYNATLELAGAEATSLADSFAAGQALDFEVDLNGETYTFTGMTSLSDIVSQINAQSTQTGIKANLNALNDDIIFSSMFGEEFEVSIRADLDGDGVFDGLDDLEQVVTATIADNTQSVNQVDISTREGADLAMISVDYAIDIINGFRAELGAVQNRFESTIANLATTSENLSASNSRIRDADFAAETAELARTQVLQQAGLSVLAQANARPQQVLQLLQG